MDNDNVAVVAPSITLSRRCLADVGHVGVVFSGVERVYKLLGFSDRCYKCK